MPPTFHLVHVETAPNGEAHIINPIMRGAVVDTKATLAALAEQHLVVCASLRKDVQRGDRLYSALARVERAFPFRFMGRELREAVSSALDAGE